MRPVRLDLDGFASFRDPASVDFTDADYFALVGPTGSGKSTVVDAMTFALYGSAPRWGSERSIQYALAPTANRCTVRLVFDVAGERYVVAREVRRSGAQISQKSTLLERYVDPAASGDPAADEATEPLAGDPKSVRTQVVELLGLEFDDFCTCVVLPQGEFQTFLKATATDRQRILLKLIGGRHYDDIGKLAGRRANDAATRIEVLTGQLAQYADATAESETAARAREAELVSLQPELTAAVSSITGLAARRASALEQTSRTTAELAALAAVRAPDGVAALQTALADAQDAYREAIELERVAATAAVRAEQAVHAGPQRKPLEEALRWHEELAAGAARLGDLATTAEESAAARDVAEATVRQAEGVLDQRRAAHAGAQARRSAAAAAAEAIRQRLAVLASVSVPAGVDQLAADAAATRTTRDKAAAERRDIEAELAEVRREIDGLPERSALDELARTIDAYEAASTDTIRLTGEQRGLSEQIEAAAARLLARTEARDSARADVEDLRARSVAADLRPHLRVGERCPVCDQSVATLPAPIEAPLLDAARTSLADAEQKLTEARDERHALASRRAALDAELRAASTSMGALDRSLVDRLPEHPSGAERDLTRDRGEHSTLTARLGSATRRQHQLDRCLVDAQRVWDNADLECDRLDELSGQAKAQLHTVLGRVAGEGPPDVETADLAAAWVVLADWAALRTGELSETDLAAVMAALQDAQCAEAETAGELTAATADQKRASEASTAAALIAQKAAIELDRLTGRVEELNRLLADRPAADQARRLIAECERLESEALDARHTAQTAIQARQTADEQREARRIAADRARTAVRDAREPLVALGAPALDEDDLGEAWSQLVEWCGVERARRDASLIELETVVTEATAGLQGELRELKQSLTDHGIDPAGHGVSLAVADPDATAQAERVPTILIVERERAHGVTAEVVRRRREAERLQGTIAKDTETQQVAAELARLMSSRRFPQWLADAALDTLVADASASLMRLSNNQFDLTHDHGEFFVIDHADADSRRSVRTLSGGETFQASLALALALSEQLATLAAGGRTTLDSIFLDEGFGTLDPDALEIVASTLENLAQDDRMVGVITHVTALAERVPVRYELSRDSRTSSIERVGP